MKCPPARPIICGIAPYSDGYQISWLGIVCCAVDEDPRTGAPELVLLQVVNNPPLHLGTQQPPILCPGDANVIIGMIIYMADPLMVANGQTRLGGLTIRCGGARCDTSSCAGRTFIDEVVFGEHTGPLSLASPIVAIDQPSSCCSDALPLTEVVCGPRCEVFTRPAKRCDPAWVQSPTVSRTSSHTLTHTPSLTPSPSRTVSRTRTATTTRTATPTATRPHTATVSPTVSRSTSPTYTPIPTRSHTPTGTMTRPPTRTHTRTHSSSWTATRTPSASLTRSSTPTPTRTPTASHTPTRTRTPTRTFTILPTPSRTRTRSLSRTPTVTPARTVSRTPTATSITMTPSRAPTASQTRTPTPAYDTDTPTPTRTYKPPVEPPSVAARALADRVVAHVTAATRGVNAVGSLFSIANGPAVLTTQILMSSAQGACLDDGDLKRLGPAVEQVMRARSERFGVHTSIIGSPSQQLTDAMLGLSNASMSRLSSFFIVLDLLLIAIFAFVATLVVRVAVHAAIRIDGVPTKLRSFVFSFSYVHWPHMEVQLLALLLPIIGGAAMLSFSTSFGEMLVVEPLDDEDPNAPPIPPDDIFTITGADGSDAQMRFASRSAPTWVLVASLVVLIVVNLVIVCGGGYVVRKIYKEPHYTYVPAQSQSPFEKAFAHRRVAWIQDDDAIDPVGIAAIAPAVHVGPVADALRARALAAAPVGGPNTRASARSRGVRIADAPIEICESVSSTPTSSHTFRYPDLSTPTASAPPSLPRSSPPTSRRGSLSALAASAAAVGGPRGGSGADDMPAALGLPPGGDDMVGMSFMAPRMPSRHRGDMATRASVSKRHLVALAAALCSAVDPAVAVKTVLSIGFPRGHWTASRVVLRRFGAVYSLGAYDGRMWQMTNNLSQALISQLIGCDLFPCSTVWPMVLLVQTALLVVIIGWGRINRYGEWTAFVCLLSGQWVVAAWCTATSYFNVPVSLSLVSNVALAMTTSFVILKILIFLGFLVHRWRELALQRRMLRLTSQWHSLRPRAMNSFWAPGPPRKAPLQHELVSLSVHRVTADGPASRGGPRVGLSPSRSQSQSPTRADESVSTASSSEIVFIDGVNPSPSCGPVTPASPSAQTGWRHVVPGASAGAPPGADGWTQMPLADAPSPAHLASSGSGSQWLPSPPRSRCSSRGTSDSGDAFALPPASARHRADSASSGSTYTP